MSKQRRFMGIMSDGIDFAVTCDYIHWGLFGVEFSTGDYPDKRIVFYIPAHILKCFGELADGEAFPTGTDIMT